jgi:hypothetical protein
MTDKEKEQAIDDAIHELDALGDAKPKLCPFCGYYGVKIIEGIFLHKYQVRCGRCNARVGGFASSMPAAMSLWNQRAKPTAASNPQTK